jgi:3-oxoacyl-[acyl-carrier protein] reductase
MTSRQTVLITGGHGALAQACAALFSQYGWIVHSPGRAELDVTDRRSISAYLDSLTRLDLLINNAGSTADALMHHMTADQWQDTIEAHLSGSFRCSRAALPRMIAQGRGHILNISSYSALHGRIGQANYNSAKAGVIALTQSLAKEYGPQNIRCNAVLPGFLDTPMTATLSPAHRQQIQQAHTLGRFNTVDHAARFIHHLQDQPHLSGQVFQLDSRV